MDKTGGKLLRWILLSWESAGVWKNFIPAPTPFFMSISRYFGIIEYNGLFFGGSQIQNNSRLPTIQSLLNSALSRFTPSLSFEGVQMGSRLDKGVHSKGLTFHFDFPNLSPPRKNRAQSPISPRAPNTILKSVNSYFRHKFSNNIRLRDIVLVSPRFHSRKDATGRIYKYKILFVHLLNGLSVSFLLTPRLVPNWQDLQEKSKIE